MTKFPSPQVLVNGSLPTETTLHFCQAVCGRSMSRYSDWAARLSAWILPVGFLVMSMQAAPVSRRAKLTMVPRVLGDPIGSNKALLRRPMGWRRCGLVAERLAGPVGDPLAVEDRQRVIRSLVVLLDGVMAMMQAMGFADEDDAHGRPRRTRLTVAEGCLRHYKHLVGGRWNVDNLRKIAADLQDNRSSDMFKGWGSTLICALSLIIVLIPALGQSIPSGTMMAAGLMLSYLLPKMVLSNRVGGWTSFNRAHEILLTALTEALQGKKGDPPSPHSGESGRDDDRLPQDFDDFWSILRLLENDMDRESLPWSGAITAYDAVHDATESLGERIVVNIVALTPVLVGYIAAAGATAAPPMYFNDRLWLIVALLLCLGLSNILSVMCRSHIKRMVNKVAAWTERSEDEIRWLLTCNKDAFFTVVILGFLIATETGF